MGGGGPAGGAGAPAGSWEWDGNGAKSTRGGGATRMVWVAGQEWKGVLPRPGSQPELEMRGGRGGMGCGPAGRAPSEKTQERGGGAQRGPGYFFRARRGVGGGGGGGALAVWRVRLRGVLLAAPSPCGGKEESETLVAVL